MFWTVIRWGGSLAVLLLVLAAGFQASQSAPAAAEGGATVIPAEGEATPIEIAPADSAPQQNKNFNL